MSILEPLSQPLFWPYFFYIALVLAAVLHMLYQRRTPQNLMAWLLALLLLPFLGVLLYVLFGSRKFLAKRKIPEIIIEPISTTHSSPTQSNPLSHQLNQLLQANQIASTTHNNHCKIYDDATEIYTQFMTEIERAQTSIHLQTYIFQLDETGLAILNALTKKAQQGIEVRLLMDAIGSFELYKNQKKLNHFVQSGGQYAFFQPLLKSLLNSQINLRNHRKIYLFDQQTLITGGINLSNEYLGSAASRPITGRWKDLMLKITGPATTHHQCIFNADWLYTTAEKLPLMQPNLALPHTPQAVSVQTIPSGPDIHNDPLFESLLHCIYNAKNSIQLVSPYFIPDSSIMNALLIAIKRGVTVSLVTPQKSDHLLFDIGRTSYIRELVEQGGYVYLDQSPMLHAKLILIDQTCLIIGSANLDYRSLFINHEIVNILYDLEHIKQMQTWVQALQESSLPYQPNNNKRYRLLENFSRIFTPLL
ncbi:Cardiolipin synthetase [hydrothermal vent metagenome]|uniref:Cardiolipin synthetase n=1 Tax=hydrothermal vent metagenome TaxID=652676 RepID=A0A3B0VR92_9ZZZZ